MYVLCFDFHIKTIFHKHVNAFLIDWKRKLKKYVKIHVFIFISRILKESSIDHYEVVIMAGAWSNTIKVKGFNDRSDHPIIFINDFLFIKFQAMVQLNIELLTFLRYSFRIIMQTPLVPQQYVICVIGEMYWTICYTIMRSVITDKNTGNCK